MSLSLWSLYSLVKIVNKYDSDFLNFIFTEPERCSEIDLNSKFNEFCLDTHTTNWLIMIMILSFVFTFLTIFPLFFMKKKNDKKL